MQHQHPHQQQQQHRQPQQRLGVPPPQQQQAGYAHPQHQHPQQHHEPKIELIDNQVVPGATRIVDECYVYSDADQIGEGTYGKVYRGTDRRGGAKVALKMIRMENEKEGFPITAIREIKLLSTLKHENIVNLREIVRSRVTRESKYKCDIYMVFDYAEHDLTGLMDATKQSALRPDQVKCIMHQLLRGLSYCHSNGILHRDLKASNLLINRQGVLKIADFGLARNYNTENNAKLTNRVITLWYRPPELLLGAEKYGPEVDVWSVGCIFAELLTRKPLFPGNNEAAQLDCIFKLMGVPTEESWPGVSQLSFYANVKKAGFRTDTSAFDEWCKRQQLPADAVSLLRSLLALDPARRISAIDATLHDYFYKSSVKMCAPSDLPRLPDCHEWTTKKRKHHHAAAAAAAGVNSHPHSSGHHHYPAQQQQGYGGGGYSQHSSHTAAGHPYGGTGAVPPGGYGGYKPPPAAAAAAGGGYRPPGSGGGGDRNVRPRQDGYQPQQQQQQQQGYYGGGGGYPPPGRGMPPGQQQQGYQPPGGRGPPPHGSYGQQQQRR